MPQQTEYVVSMTVKRVNGKYHARGALARSDGTYAQGEGSASNVHTAVSRATEQSYRALQDAAKKGGRSSWRGAAQA